MNRTCACIAPLALACSPCLGQSDFSRVAWQASLDGGQSWQGGTVEVADPFARVRIRALVDWEYPGSYALALVQFDATISTQGSIGLADIGVDLERISPFDRGSAQTLAATRFGNTLKIDDERDTFAPGVGDRAIMSGQLVEVAGPPFTRDNPVPVFAYSLVLDGTLGTRIVSHVWRRHPTSGEILRTWIYLSPEGGIGMPRTSLVEPLNLHVIPTPTSLALLLPLLASHRRRRE